MTSTIKGTPFFYRLLGAAALDASTYEEVEVDPRATAQAFWIVVLSSLAAGVGTLGLGHGTVSGVVLVAIAALLTWAAWALLTLQIGGWLLRQPNTRVDLNELLRTIGFATTPGLLLVLGALPGATIPTFAISGVWMLAAMILAIREALDFESTARAVGVCLLGWLLALGAALVLGLLFGPSVS